MLIAVYLEELWGTSKASTSLMEMPHMNGMAVMRFHHPTLIPCIDFTISSGKVVGGESKNHSKLTGTTTDWLLEMQAMTVTVLS